MSNMKTLTQVCLLICAMMALTEAGVPVLYDTAEVRVKRSTPCPSGWTGISDRCFRYVPRLMTWARAEKICLSMHAHLASVHSSDEYHDIQNMITKITHQYTATWLGGSDAQENGHWLWNDGSHFKYNHWCPGEPNNGRGKQHCLQMNYSDKKCWDDVECFVKLPFVCAKTPN